MPRFTTSLLLCLLLVLSLLSASCRGTSTAPTDAAAALFPESQALDRRVIIRPRPRPDVDPDTGGGAGSYPPSPGGRYPGDPPPSRNKDDDDDDNNSEAPDLPDGGDAATTKPSAARCTTSCNAAATGTSSSETTTPSSSPSPTQLPIANESARHGARLSLALAGILPLLVLLLA